MKKLVPVYQQSKKLSCGPAALRMVLEYYGVKKSEKEIAKAVGGIRKYGIKTVDLGWYAKKLGYKVELLSYNRKLSKDRAKIKKTQITDILKFIKKEIPLILAVRSCLLHDKKYSKLGHFIVITDYKKGLFYYNDPLDGKRHRIERDSLLLAWYNNVLESSAYLLAVWK